MYNDIQDQAELTASQHKKDIDRILTQRLDALDERLEDVHRRRTDASQCQKAPQEDFERTLHRIERQLNKYQQDLVDHTKVFDSLKDSSVTERADLGGRIDDLKRSVYALVHRHDSERDETQRRLVFAETNNKRLQQRLNDLETRILERLPDVAHGSSARARPPSGVPSPKGEAPVSRSAGTFPKPMTSISPAKRVSEDRRDESPIKRVRSVLDKIASVGDLPQSAPRARQDARSHEKDSSVPVKRHYTATDGSPKPPQAPYGLTSAKPAGGQDHEPDRDGEESVTSSRRTSRPSVPVVKPGFETWKGKRLEKPQKPRYPWEH